MGDLIGAKYRMFEPIGKGGAGVVLHCRDEMLERDVAIKIIRPEWCTERSFKEGFLAEARSMARVNHPNVVRIFDYGEHQGLPFFVMEYFEGIDLDSWLSRRDDWPMPIDEALRLGEQICQGVEAIHEAHTVHLDLKPGNVLVGRRDRVAVGDFGLARTAFTSRTKVAGLGTPGFMAPELITGTGEQAQWSLADTYALGAILYELLCGTPPFDGETAFEVLDQQVTGIPKRPSEVRPALTGAYDEVILQCLSYEPEDRPTVSEVLGALGTSNPVAADATAGRRVLVVDDDADTRKFLGRSLAAALPQLTIDEAASGREALEALSTHEAALVITDLRMPDLDGAGLLEAIRADGTMNRVTVLVVTGDASSGEWRRLREMGADSILLKPVEVSALVALVRDLLERGRRDWSSPPSH